MDLTWLIPFKRSKSRAKILAELDRHMEIHHRAQEAFEKMRIATLDGEINWWCECRPMPIEKDKEKENKHGTRNSTLIPTTPSNHVT